MRKSILLGAVASLIATAAVAEHHEKGEKKMMAPPELTGVFTTDEWTMTLMPEGLGVGVVNENNRAFAVIKHGSKDGKFWLKDIVSPSGSSEESAKCATENKGKYSYSVDEGVLSFTLIEDPCTNRAEALNGLSATEVETPEPAADE